MHECERVSESESESAREKESESESSRDKEKDSKSERVRERPHNDRVEERAIERTREGYYTCKNARERMCAFAREQH